jgi:arylsulfatase A-like enzyme
MTRHKHEHTGLVTPSPLDHWIDVMLRVLAVLVSSVASTLQMTRRRLAAECHSDVTPTVLPREKSDTQQQETQSALILRDRDQAVRIVSGDHYTPRLRRWRQYPLRCSKAVRSRGRWSAAHGGEHTLVLRDDRLELVECQTDS